MLSKRTFTCGSPNSQRIRPVVYLSTSACTRPGSSPRTPATRAAWILALATEMSGSSPLNEVVTMSTGTPSVMFFSVLMSCWTCACTRLLKVWLEGPRLLPVELVAGDGVGGAGVGGGG